MTTAEIGVLNDYRPGAATSIGTAASLTERDLQPRVWRIHLAWPAPPWLRILVDRINELAHLPAGWDSYGGHPLSEDSAREAVSILRAAKFGGPPPHVSVSPDGLLLLRWRADVTEVEIEILPTGTALVLLETGGDIEEFESPPNGERFREVLQGISSTAVAG